MSEMISVILPVYNRERYIADAIKSVISQTYRNWEMIIVDDGSTDNTAAVCKKYIDQDGRIQYFYQKNTGVSSARNYALKLTRGGYVTFIDADDIYDSERLAEFIEIIERIENCDIIYTGFKTFTEETGRQLVIKDLCVEEKIEDHDNFFHRVFLDECMNAVWRCLFRTEIAKTISFNQLRFAEDLFYVLEYAQKISKAVYTTSATYFYRIDNPNSMLRNEKNKTYLQEYKMIPVLMSQLMDKYSLSNTIYRKKMTSEYALAIDRIRSMVSFHEFIDIVDDHEFRVGLDKIMWDCAEKKKSLYAFIIRYRLYFLFKLEELSSKIYWKVKGKIHSCLDKK